MEPSAPEPTEGTANTLSDEEKSWIWHFRRRIKLLNGAVIGLGALLLAGSSVMAGDSLDPLQLGQEALVQSSFEQQARPLYLAVNTEHDSAVSARTAPDAVDDSREEGGDGDTPTPCEDEIRSDLAPERPLSIDFVQDAAESIPNVHQEHYIAVTSKRRVAYLCTIVLIPFDVSVIPTGMAPIPSKRITAPRG